MCTLCLYSDTIASADLYVFGSVWPPYLVIYWFILLFLVLCCDIIIVTPWSRSCTLRVWLLYMIVNRGRYKLVSEPTACRKPPNHSLVEVESSICKNYFANLLFGLRAHIDVTTCDISGIRIFYSVPILWDSALSSFRVKEFANSDIRFSWLLPPGEPLIADDHRIHQKTPKITLR